MLFVAIAAGVLCSLLIEQRKQRNARASLLLQGALSSEEEAALHSEVPLEDPRLATAHALVASATQRAARAESAAAELAAELAAVRSRSRQDSADSEEDEASECRAEAEACDTPMACEQCGGGDTRISASFYNVAIPCGHGCCARCLQRTRCGSCDARITSVIAVHMPSDP